MTARFSNNYEEAYQYVASEDKFVKSLQKYLDEWKSKDTAIILAMRSKVTWEIKDFRTEKDRSFAKVDLLVPNLMSKKDEDKMNKKRDFGCNEKYHALTISFIVCLLPELYGILP